VPYACSSRVHATSSSLLLRSTRVPASPGD
jgi:hypothetical protein